MPRAVGATLSGSKPTSQNIAAPVIVFRVADGLEGGVVWELAVCGPLRQVVPSRVVGVVRDFRPSMRRFPQPEVYVAAAQESAALKLVVQSELPPDAVALQIRGAILAEDPDVPIAGILRRAALCGTVRLT